MSQTLIAPPLWCRRIPTLLGRLASIAALAACCGEFVPTHADEPTQRDIEFARVGDRSLKLDLYQPPPQHSAPRPVVVWVHGGAWRSGSKDNVPVTRWLEHGFAIASVEYRLSPEAKFPAQIHDIKAAIRFLRAKSVEYGLKRNAFVLTGGSAGGHLAALAGVSSGVKQLEGTVGSHLDEPSDVQAIISFYGAGNLQSILGQSTPFGLSVRVPALELLLGGQPDQVPELARLASPVAHVDRDDPALWLIHGDADPQMPIEQSREFAAAYRQAGRPVDFQVIGGGKHGGPEFFASERLDSLAQAVQGELKKRP